MEALDALDRDDRGLTFVEDGEDHRLSYASLAKRSGVLAGKLAGLGLRKGDRAVMVVASQREFIQLFLGAVCAGVVPVPLYPPYVLAQLDSYLVGLDRILAITGASALITSAPVGPLFGRLGSPVRLLTLDDVLAGEEAASLPHVGPDDLAFVQFTSGSTAAPKGVMVPHRALIESAAAIGAHLGIAPEHDRGVSWLPLYHDFGLIGFMITPMLEQAPVWYLAPLDFARNPTSWPELIDRVDGTAGSAPNFGYELLARRVKEEQLERWDLSSWRIAACGAEPIRPATLRAFAAKFERAGFSTRAFLPCYGLAEATLAVSLWPVEEAPRTLVVDVAALRERGSVEPARDGEPTVELMSCGPPIPRHEVAIHDAEGRPLPEWREGEIAFRGPSVTAGYVDDPKVTTNGFRDGWVHTGDLGFLADGEVYPTGRRQDVMIVAGRRYHPQDVEWCAGEVEGVRRGCTIAFTVETERGEAPVLAVEAQPDGDPDALRRAIAARVRGHLGIVLEEVVVVDRGDLPKTSSGKPRRAETRGRYARGELDGSRPSSG